MKCVQQIIFGIALSALSGTSHANEAQLQSYKLEVTQAELNAISDGLGEIQYKRAYPLIQKLNAQIIEQIESAKKAQDERKKPEPQQ